jgi:hypothetical protein
LAIPGSDRRIAAELARPKWGGFVLSPNGVWRVLRRHGLHTRSRRLGLVAGYAAPPEPERPEPEPARHIEVDHPGELVQVDCFCIGRLAGTKGTVWQYCETLQACPNRPDSWQYMDRRCPCSDPSTGVGQVHFIPLG